MHTRLLRCREKEGKEETAVLGGKNEPLTIHELETFIRNHWQDVYRFIYRLVRNKEEAEDITQEVFVKAYLHVATFERRAAFSSWVYRIAITSTYDALERSKTRRHTTLVLQQQRAEHSNQVEGDPEAYVLQKERRESIQSILTQLDQEKAHLLIMRDLEHRRYHDIATLLHVKPTTLKMRIHRARRSFQEHFLRRDP